MLVGVGTDVKSEPAQNQTVEEILAHIRQAISEDEIKRGLVRTRAGAEPPRQSPGGGASAADDDDTDAHPPEAQDVIDLAIEKALDGVKAGLTGDGDQPDADGGPEPEAGRGTPHAVVQPTPQVGPRFQSPPKRDDQRRDRPLLSPRVGAAVSASFDNLARSMASINGRNLDELVEAMLRPMLRSWLDDNLPLLVERLVREEIERVSRGRR